MRLLVHTCCAPCLVAPARQWAAEGYELLVYWYNPNVQPFREYKRRLGALRELAQRGKLRLEVEDRYDPDFFLREVVTSRVGRCERCYAERLGRAAARAREAGSGAFTTTLLISRRQDHDAIITAGKAAAREHGVEFIDRDLRTLDEESHRLAKEMGLYL